MAAYGIAVSGIDHKDIHVGAPGIGPSRMKTICKHRSHVDPDQEIDAVNPDFAARLRPPLPGVRRMVERVDPQLPLA